MKFYQYFSIACSLSSIHSTTDMICGICGENESKYTCPKCLSKYCSLACFKSAKHVEMDEKKSELKENVKEEEKQVESTTAPQAEIDDPMVAALVKEPQFQEYIQSPIIQFHLFTILEIMENVSLTNEYSRDGRLEIASRKLNNLRTGGVEENEYMEEFVEWLLVWIEEYKQRATE